MRTMYFGTKRRMSWIKVHSPSSGYAHAGYTERFDYLNGGTSPRSSVNGRMEYDLTWNRVTAEEARTIADYASGLFGDGPFYLSDPVSMRQNVLNKAWSAPGITAKDGVPIAGHVRPLLVENLDLSRGCPANMAQYTLGELDDRRTFYLPVPPGHTAHISVRGDAESTLGLNVQPTASGITAGTAVVIPVAGMGDDVTPTAFSATGTQYGLELSIEAGAGTITLGAIMVQVLPNGAVADHRRYISGQGASGLAFDGKVQPVPYSIAHDSYGLSARLVEYEDWI